MNKLEIHERIKELKKASGIAERILEIPVDGRLEVYQRGNRFIYRKNEMISEKDGESHSLRTYIRKSDISQAKKLAQRDYAKELLCYAEEEIRILEELEKCYEGVHAHTLLEHIHPGRQCLVKPILLSDEEYAKEWLKKRSGIVNSYPVSSEIYTEKHELVRSKTEKIIADRLYYLGVPYKYEEALKLNGEIVFPDFTILNKWTRKVSYWEHYGRIDYEDYRMRMIQKNNMYSRNDIVAGDNLIMTFETMGTGLSTAQIDKIIKRNFLQ